MSAYWRARWARHVAMCSILGKDPITTGPIEVLPPPEIGGAAEAHYRDHSVAWAEGMTRTVTLTRLQYRDLMREARK